MKKFLPVFLIVTISQFFSGCEKDPVDPFGRIGDPSIANPLLSKVVYDADALVDVYEYNDKKEVVKITTASIHDPEPLNFSLYYYDDDSKLIKREFYKREVNHQLAAFETFDWEGNEVTKLIYILYYDSDNQKIAEELYQKHVYELNERLETTRLTEFQNIPGLGLLNSSYTDFTWVNGNVTEKNIWQLSDNGALFFHKAKITMKYDDQWNPYRVLPHEVLTRPWLNNLIEEKDAYDDYITTYTYAYHESGYIQSGVKKKVHLEDTSDVQVERFFYEYTPID